jgi:hypothetical protein
MSANRMFGLLAAAACFAACVSSGSASFPLQGVPRREPTAASSVELLDQAGERRYVALGKVHAHGRCEVLFSFRGTDQRLLQLLREEAAKLGASAVINVQTATLPRGEWLDVHLHGTAIGW